jgi:hypothetical protein
MHDKSNNNNNKFTQRNNKHISVRLLHSSHQPRLATIKHMYELVCTMAAMADRFLPAAQRSD